MKITVGQGQTIYDIAIQEYGSIDGVDLLLKDNPSLDMATMLAPGSILHIKSEPIDKAIVDHYKINDIRPAGRLSSEKRIGGDFNNDFNADFN